MLFHSSCRSFPVISFSLGVLGLLSGPAVEKTQAYTTVTNITTQNLNSGASTINTTGSGGSAVDFNTNDNFQLNFAGNLRKLQQFTTSGTTYEVLPVTYSVNLVRNPLQQTNNILWQPFTSTTPAFSNTGAQNFTVALPGVPGTDMESAFSSGSLNTGTDNLFVNTGDANGNQNNIERLDVYYSAGLVSGIDLAFPIFERGPTGGHDSFKIAAILTTDVSGNPTSFGPLLSVTTGWGNTSLGALDTIVLRNLVSSPGSGAEFVSAHATGQFLGGTSIMAVGDLGVASGSQFYGYSLFGADVTAVHDLLDISTFPNDTPNTSTGGGVDMVGSFQAFRAIPEPGSSALALASLAMLATKRRRRSSSN